jgi:hypothetical protein
MGHYFLCVYEEAADGDDESKKKRFDEEEDEEGKEGGDRPVRFFNLTNSPLQFFKNSEIFCPGCRFD